MVLSRMTDITILKNNRSHRKEHDEQTALFGLFKATTYVSPLFDLVFAIPNQGIRGGRAGKISGSRFKAEGKKKGVPDIMVPVANKDYHGLFIEMKTKYNSAEKEQIEWMQRLKQQGYDAIVSYSAIDAFIYTCKYILNVESLTKRTKDNIEDLINTYA